MPPRDDDARRRLAALEARARPTDDTPRDLLVTVTDVYMTVEEALRVGSERRKRPSEPESMTDLRVEVVHVLEEPEGPPS